MKRVELLAPAGSMESFYGALNAGADAIYLAGDKFGARAYAKNFTENEVIDAIITAHLYGKKVYLTVNTLIKDSEMEGVYEFIKPFYEAGLDGVILQDFGVANYIKQYFPGLEMHASTQMTLTGPFAANYLKEQGFSRIVPSRELSLEEIKTIRKNSSIELECFVHGAMCYCYSGQCLFSSVLGGRSGNRGRCAQPCRLNYAVKDEKGNTTKPFYPLSMKDQETILLIGELIEAGIDSFKIEGRMKKPEYAAGVTAIYRRAIDAYYNTGKATVSKQDLQALSKLYRRSEKQEGYYHTKNGKEMITLSSPSYNGADEAYLQSIRETYIKQPKKLGISGFASFVIGQEASLTCSYGDIYVTVSGDICARATNASVSLETIKEQMSKLGNTQFVFDSLEVTADDGLFYSLKGIKELRRKAIDALTEAIITSFKLPVGREAKPFVTGLNSASCVEKIASGYTMLLSTKEQLQTLLSTKMVVSPLKAIYLEGALALGNAAEDLVRLKKKFTNTRFLLALPYIIRSFTKKNLEQMVMLYKSKEGFFDGFLVRNQESYAYLMQQGIAKDCIVLDANMYLYNDSNIAWWSDKAKSYCMPYEMTLPEQERVAQKSFEQFSVEKIVYGKIPMMVSANCIAKTTGSCFGSGVHSYQLVDRYKVTFDVDICCDTCYNIIYNSVPYVSVEGERKLNGLTDFRISFTTEGKKEMEQVLMYFGDKSHGKPAFQYTTGFDKKSVE